MRIRWQDMMCGATATLMFLLVVLAAPVGSPAATAPDEPGAAASAKPVPAGDLVSGAKTADAENDKVPGLEPLSLARIGLDLEAARALPAAQRPEALRSVASALARREKEGVEGSRQAALYLLQGELLLAQDDAQGARDAFERAGKKSDDDALAAAADLARIQAMEAEGRDTEATKEWRRWIDRHAGSPLLPDARLCLAWNWMRRADLEKAGNELAGLAQDCPWFTPDPRYVLADAMVAYLAGRPQDALLRIGSVPGAAAAYLKALCHEETGDVLKAAASFQEVAERYPDSPLREHALLAKADTFLRSNAWRSAAEEFGRVLEVATTPAIRAEAALRRAACSFLADEAEASVTLLRAVVTEYPGTSAAARAQFLLGEVAVADGRQEDAIREFNRVLTSHFEASVAASAQYRVGRCLDALGRKVDATGAYQAVVEGYPLEPEAPAAAYLAGVGLLEQGRPHAAVPYFQLVLDRYASREDADGTIVFASPEHQELVEAALCLLQLSYHRAGDLGQLAGAPHLLLQKTPASSSPWRAYALLIDADAMASQGQLEESRSALDRLLAEFPEHPVAMPANQLLAWIQAQQGNPDLAIQTQEKMLERYAQVTDRGRLAQAFLGMAHVRFNRQEYAEAAAGYEEFLARYPDHAQRLLALYQAGLCYLRLDRAGDAVDSWEAVVQEDPTAPIAERAFARAGDVYFQAGAYDDARRCYQGLLANFGGSSGAAVGLLRIAQCDFNAGRDAEALAGYAAVLDRFGSTREGHEAERGMEMALYRLGQKPEGEEELRKLVSEHPGSAFAADAQFGIAQRRYEEEDFVTAAEEFRRVVSQFPSASTADRAQFLMADAWQRAGQPEEARRALEQFLIFFPDSELRTDAHFRLGMLCFEADDPMRAAVEFTGVLEQDPPTETARAALYNLGLCQLHLGQDEQAQASLIRYRERWPEDERSAEIALQLGDIHERAGRTEAAIAELQRALKAKPPAELQVELNYRIGRCRETGGEDVAALAAYEKAGACPDRADPFRLSALARAAALYEKREDYRKALTAYRDLAEHTTDPELAAAASGRASELAAIVK
jgi:TolA-binding protein